MKTFLFQSNQSVPRQATQSEMAALYDYAEQAFDLPRSDAQGLIDCCYIAVFEDAAMFIPNYEAKVMVIFSGGKPNEVYVLTWHNDSWQFSRRYVEQ